LLAKLHVTYFIPFNLAAEAHLKAKTHQTTPTSNAKKLLPTLKSLGKSGLSNFLLALLVPSPIIVVARVIAAMVPKA
jgi:hypothetical protein